MDWKLDALKSLIEIEKEKGEDETTITMKYINYLRNLVKMIEYGKTQPTKERKR